MKLHEACSLLSGRSMSLAETAVESVSLHRFPWVSFEAGARLP